MAVSPSNQSTLLKKLTGIVLANLGNEHFGVKELARESGMSRYSLGRKLRAVEKKTVNQFIRDVRLQKALEIRSEERRVGKECS
jgi:AraC-like DNA-binding protein